MLALQCLREFKKAGTFDWPHRLRNEYGWKRYEHQAMTILQYRCLQKVLDGIHIAQHANNSAH